jgi:hypothetical protein
MRLLEMQLQPGTAEHVDKLSHLSFGCAWWLAIPATTTRIQGPWPRDFLLRLYRTWKSNIDSVVSLEHIIVPCFTPGGLFVSP